jgi:hypothetical protein
MQTYSTSRLHFTGIQMGSKLRWPNLSLSFANRAGQVRCPLGRSTSTTIKAVNFATASPCIPSEKENCGGRGPSGEFGSSGLLATCILRVRMVQRGATKGRGTNP